MFNKISNIMRNYKYSAVVFVILFFGLSLGALNIANAQTNIDAPKVALTFPISDLGNCQDKNSCEEYCSLSSNYLACAEFGEKNNLISKEDLARTKEFADVLKGEGPGACKDENSCKSFCNDLSNINECLTFAEKHNLLPDEELNEAKKVSKALKAGATMPGNCKDKSTCDNYCKSGEHLDECLNFAEKAGFIDEEEASLVRKIGGKGPNGCMSREACDSYCNKKENQRECFNFAKEKGLIPEEKLKEMEDGIGRLRAGLDQMPSEAISCLKDSLGDGVIGEIQSGNFTPGPDAGDIIKGCFDKVLPQLQAKLQSGLQMATPETLKCLEDKLGKGEFKKIQEGGALNPESGDIIKKCFDMMKTEGLKMLKGGLSQMPTEMKNCIIEKIGAPTVDKIEGGEDVEMTMEMGIAMQSCVMNNMGSIQQKIDEGLKKAPPEMQDCIKSAIGDIGEKVKSGDYKGLSDIPSIIQDCVSKGVKIPQSVNIDALKKMQETGGDDRSSQQIESLKALQNQYKDMIPEGVSMPVINNIPSADEIKKIQEQMQAEYMKIPQADLEQYKKMQEQGQFENAPVINIPTGSSGGMGM